jgi:hypothetical protein
MLGRDLPRYDGLGCVGGPVEMLETAHVLCDFNLTCEAFRRGDLVARTPNEYARTWFPTDPAVIHHLIPANQPLPSGEGGELIILSALVHRVHVAFVEFHRLMDVRRRTCTDEEGIAAKEARVALEREEMAKFDFSPKGNFRRMASYIRRCAENTHTMDYALQQACFMWKQYLSVHFQLMRYFWLHPKSPELWRDRHLTTTIDEAVKSVYEAYYPDVRRPISINMLPNLATTVSRLGWFRETSPNRGEAVSHLLSKVMNKICAVRGWTDIAKTYMENNDGIMELMMMCTMVSVLRLYPRSEECTTMATAMSMWHRFSTMTENTEEYKNWLNENSQLMWFSLREYLLFILQRCHVLYYVLTRFNNVPPVAQSVTRGMDHACRVFNLHGTLNDPGLNINVQNMLLTEYYKAEQLKYPIHVHKKSFLEIVWSSLCRVFEKNFIHDRQSCYVGHTAPDQVEIIRKYVAKLDPNASLIFRRCHFVHWGLQEQMIENLFACKYSYEISSDADHSTSSQLKIILRLPAPEFFLLFNLVHLMNQHCSFEPIPLSMETAEAQVSALRTRFNIMPWECVSRDHYATHMCHKCKRICTRVSVPCWRSSSGAAAAAAAAAAANGSGTSSSSSSKSGGIGLFAESGFANDTLLCLQQPDDHVRYDPARETLVCRRSTQLKPGSFQEHRFFSIKDETKRSQLYKAGNRVSTGTVQNEARHLRQLILGEYCRDTPVTLIPMIGVAWRIAGKIFAACETCFNIVELSINTHGPRGITCTGHIHDDWALYRPRQLLYPRVGPIPPPLDSSRMPSNLVIHNSGYDWQVLDQLGEDAQLFSVAKRIEAREILRKGRSVPAGTDPETYNGAALSASAARRNESVKVTLQMGVLRSSATVGWNGLMLILTNSPQLTKDWKQALRHSSHCYFCNVIRIKQGRPDDRAWVVFAVNDEQSSPLLIFLCASCKSAVPSILKSGVINSLGLENLSEIKQRVIRQRGSGPSGSRFYQAKMVE